MLLFSLLFSSDLESLLSGLICKALLGVWDLRTVYKFMGEFQATGGWGWQTLVLFSLACCYRIPAALLKHGFAQ